MSASIPRPSPEWVSAIVSAALILLVSGAIAYEWVAGGDSPPRLVVRHGDLAAHGGLLYVPFEVLNAGDTTAAGVAVVGELRRGGRVHEQSTMHVDFVSPGERASGQFIFSGPVEGAEVVVRPTGFRTPP